MSSQGPSDLVTTIGRNIRSARTAANLTQRALAHKLDTDAVLVSKWERGVHRPGDENLMGLSRVLGRGPGWFYTDHDLEKAA